MAFAAATLPFITAGAGLAGTAVQAAGTLEAGQATSEAATYQAQVAANNAIIANQNADYTIAAGERKAADVSMRGAENVAKVAEYLWNDDPADDPFAVEITETN